MSGKGRNASGISQKVIAEVVRRNHDIRALWLAVLNDPRPVADLSTEFYFKVGELMEGKPLASLTYSAISRDRVLKLAEDP